MKVKTNIIAAKVSIVESSNKNKKRKFMDEQQEEKNLKNFKENCYNWGKSNYIAKDYRRPKKGKEQAT